MRSFILALWRDDRGQSTTEYILILSVVVMIALKFKNTFSGLLDGIVTSLGANIQSAVSTNGP